MMVDQFPYTPHIIRENREILSVAQLDKMNEKFPIKINSYDYEKTHNINNRKPKQLKVKWSDEEQKLFLEGLNIYGSRSIIIFISLKKYIFTVLNN